MKKVVQALPQYSEQYDKLSLHVGIAEKIKKIMEDTGLKDVGQLEQDLAFGDAGTKEVINFLRLKQLARISADDMNAVTALRFLGTPDTKKASSGGFSLKFDMQKKKHAARKDRNNGEEQWQLSRFYPLIEELIENLSKGELSKNEYACMNGPSQTLHGTGTQGLLVRTSSVQPAHSMRSRRTATWASRSHGSVLTMDAQVILY